MDDREFFDVLYTLWVKTTGASDRYWDVDGDRVRAVGQSGEPVVVAAGVGDADADFITALHGCFPDLVRRLHTALDEADRLDREMDDVQSRLAAAELRIAKTEAGGCYVDHG